MFNRKASVFVVLVLAVSLAVAGCSSKPKANAEGYIQLISLSGNTNMESKEFTITVPDNRFTFSIKDSNNDGVKGQVIKVQGVVQDVASSFNIGPNQKNDSWPFNLEPGTYKIKVESTGTKFEISMEEKAPQK